MRRCMRGSGRGRTGVRAFAVVDADAGVDTNGVSVSAKVLAATAGVARVRSRHGRTVMLASNRRIERIAGFPRRGTQ